MIHKFLLSDVAGLGSIAGFLLVPLQAAPTGTRQPERANPPWERKTRLRRTLLVGSYPTMTKGREPLRRYTWKWWSRVKISARPKLSAVATSEASARSIGAS